MKIEAIPEVDIILHHLIPALNIESVICYGSYSAGIQDENSDIDLLILVKKLPQVFELKKLYESISVITKFEIKDLSHWDSAWTLHNTVLLVQGVKIELGFNTLSWVKKVVKKLIQDNQISFKELSFRPYTFLGLLEHSQCLYDKHHFVKRIKSKIRPFPFDLKAEIVKSFLPLLRDCYEDLVDNLQRDIGILSFQFQVFMGMDAIIQLLWVINDVYDPASKRTEFYLSKLKDLPLGFNDFIQVKLPNSYVNKKEFIDAFRETKQYLEKRLSELELIK